MSLYYSLIPILVIDAYIIGGLVVFSFIYKKLPLTPDVQTRHSSAILNKWIREYWMWVTSPVMRFFVRFQIRPNTISLWGTVFAGLSGVAFAVGEIGLAGWLMICGASLDFFDGRVARATGQITHSGAFFDSSMDRISEGLTLSGIAYLYRNSPVFWIVMLVYLGSMLTSYTKARGENMGVEYAGGMMQRPERIVYIGASGALMPMLVAIAAYFFPQKITDIVQTTYHAYIIPLTLVAIGTNVTTYHRVVNIMGLLDKKYGERKP
jgi:CDP-diacylglycerol--glycerol-3-phosphate 3-phosphatidyltransferase